ncbi:MAG TPA: flagellar hook-length control protein FliK [Candidatus Binataceae bacterium]|nr:flagellar hook-length control protein FliK [Candidatus Binataceae bacterium]
MNAEPAPPAVTRPMPPAVPENAVQRERAPESSRPESPEAPRPSEPALPEPPAAVKAAAPARDIKLEVTGGDQRVEVRLTERAGELRVAVRAADPHMAGTLRENLPALSSRLAESGFRAETWHPGAAAPGEWRRASDAGAGSQAQDSNQQSGRHGDGQEPGDADSGRPKAPQEPIERKEKGKDFAWLISSLQ